MNSKGVSPIVAEVLLLGIAIASVSSAAVFLGDLFDGVKEDVDNSIDRENEIERSEIDISKAYNESGYLAFDVRNDGSIALQVEDEDEKLWTMYIEENNNGERPLNWSYFSNSPYKDQSNVLLGVSSDISINTTLRFPDPGNRTRIEIQGPNDIGAGTVCYSQGESCE